jgi:hypothetical protein
MLFAKASLICSLLSLGNHSLFHSVNVTIFFSSFFSSCLSISFYSFLWKFWFFFVFAQGAKEDGKEKKKRNLVRAYFSLVDRIRLYRLQSVGG